MMAKQKVLAKQRPEVSPGWLELQFF